MLCKAIENYVGRKDYEPLLLALRAIPAWSLESTDMRSPKYRWLVIAFIHVVTFWKLEIRHSCCDLSRIQHGFFMDGLRPFDSHASPIRYPLENIRRIRKEDAFLLDLLDDLTQEFELELNLQSFFKYVWEINIEMVLKKLEKEDVGRYGTGRREMGVMMEMISEEAMDDGSEVGTDDKSEDDGVQGSDHDGYISGEDENGL